MDKQYSVIDPCLSLDYPSQDTCEVLYKLGFRKEGACQCYIQYHEHGGGTYYKLESLQKAAEAYKGNIMHVMRNHKHFAAPTLSDLIRAFYEAKKPLENMTPFLYPVVNRESSNIIHISYHATLIYDVPTMTNVDMPKMEDERPVEAMALLLIQAVSQNYIAFR